MSFDTLAVQVRNLSKVYNIYNKPIDRLKQSLVPRLLKVIGRPPHVYYHEFWALRNVSLEVQKGETVGIIGRNGSGKSTLLQIVCGTLTATSGEYKTWGRIAALLELGSGFNPEFTGRENVFLNGAILGLSQEEISQRFDAIAAFADIGEFIEQPVKFYSSGMMVRLAFAVQAMVDPEILIVDEALAVGDERFQRKCFHRLEELKKNGTTVLFVSHTGQQIIELCDRALLLERGQRLLFGDPLAVVRAYQRMIYADPVEQARMVEEFHEIDQSNKTQSGELPIQSHQEQITLQPLSIGTNDEVEFFDNNMIPESTEILPVMGARINSISILNKDGKKINNLLVGREYSIQTQGVFLEDHESVSFGIHIRTRTGLNIAGISHPELGTFFPNVRKGQKYSLTFKINMLLAPDIYFVGAGVWTSKAPIRLHQVLDFAMFRVMSIRKKYAFGYVDLTIGDPVFDIF